MAGGEDAVRSTWTDERLDDFKGSVESRMDTLERRMDRLDQRLDELQHTMVHGFVAMFAAMLTGFLSMAGLIMTQL